MGKTTIEWTGETWNPVRGCKMVSPGCANCYAMRQAGRFSGEGGAYAGLVKLRPGKGYAWTGDFREVPEMLDVPLRRRTPTTFFVNSMSDLFGEGVSNEFIAAVFGVMAATPKHTYQVLTKRAERLDEWFAWIDKNEDGAGVAACQAATVLYPNDRETHLVFEHRVDDAWPLPNVWLGVSVEDQKHGLPRIKHLRRTPAALRFLSIEPMLEDLGEIDLTSIGWVIVGGESGTGARPFDLAWARSIRDQCRAAGVPFFFKQSGARPVDSSPASIAAWEANVSAGWHGMTADDGKPLNLLFKDKKGGDLAELPEDLRIREMPEGHAQDTGLRSSESNGVSGL